MVETWQLIQRLDLIISKILIIIYTLTNTAIIYLFCHFLWIIQSSTKNLKTLYEINYQFFAIIKYIIWMKTFTSISASYPLNIQINTKNWIKKIMINSLQSGDWDWVSPHPSWTSWSQSKRSKRTTNQKWPKCIQSKAYSECSTIPNRPKLQTQNRMYTKRKTLFSTAKIVHLPMHIRFYDSQSSYSLLLPHKPLSLSLLQ